MTTFEEMRESARGEIAWHIEGRAQRAGVLRRTRAWARTLPLDARARNEVVRSLAGTTRADLERCGTPAARRRTAAALRAAVADRQERTDWDALPCGDQDHLVERLEYALALATELER